MGFKSTKYKKLKYTQEEYIKFVSSIDENVEVIGEYKGSSIPTLIKYKDCGHLFPRTTDHIKRKRGCPYCNNIIPLKGFNDLSVIRKDIYDLLKDKDNACYFPYSRKYEYFICPNCGKEHYKKIADVCMYGLRCDRCDDGFSYPEKFFRSLLLQLGIEYESQKIFDFALDKKYDFYIGNKNIIVETHGLQHYENRNNKFNTRDEQANDKLKRELANNNGINNYYEIDCRYSNKDYIMNSIINSKVLDILDVDIDIIDWNKCTLDASNSLAKQTWDLWNSHKYSNNEIAKILNVASTTTSHYLNIGTDLGICDYDGQLERNKASSHSVVLTNTGEIFEYMEDAIKKYGKLNISGCCRGVIISAGKMPDGTPMVWRYLEDYDPALDYTYNNKTIKKIICLETLKIYNKIVEASIDYNLSESSINLNLNRMQSFAGRDKITKMPLHWMYYDEYLKSSEEDIYNFMNNYPIRYSSIICINTLKIYTSASEALSDCSLSTVSPITDCCKGKIKTAGFVNGEKAVWMYYKDYLKSDLYKNQVA